MPPTDHTNAASAGDYRYDAFISYSHADAEWVRGWLLPRLEAAGLRVCVDFRDFDIGTAALDNMERAVAASRHTLLVLTQAWVDSEWTRFETLLVQGQDPAGLHRRTLPLLRRPCAVPQRIATLTYADLSGADDDQAEFARLLDAIRDVPRLPDNRALVSLGQPLGHNPAVAAATIAALPLDHVPGVAPLPAGSRMPLSPNPLFVGREAELKRLAAALKVGETVAIGPTTAATGPGGIGKTQLAAEFAHRYGQYFAGGVFWLSFADSNAVPAEIASCGGPLGMDLPGLGEQKLDEQVARVRQVWLQPLPCLLVFDNCEDEELLARWRPPSGGCRVLVSSRRALWDASLGVAGLPLDVLSRMESIALLRRFRPDLPEGDADLDAIAAELGDLPLALHLAGSYLASYRRALAPAGYLAELRNPALLRHRSLRGGGLSPTGHLHDIGRSFALSYERLDAADPTNALALALLARAAHFAPGVPIPHELLRATIEVAGNDAALQIEDALARLVALGLLEETGGDALRLHRLLAAFVRDVSADAAAQGAVEQALLERARRINNAGLPAPLLPVQPHLRAVTDAALSRGDERAAGLCSTLDYHLSMIGDYASARPYSEQALAIRERALGPEHFDTAASLNNLGTLLHDQGDYAGARAYYERALAIKERALGPEHSSTATSLNNLGMLLLDQDNYAAAQPYLERALAIKERALGPEHPNTVRSLNNLGLLFHAEGDYPAAQSYFERALAIFEQVLGPEHPDTATSLNNLGGLLRDQGDYAGAQAYLERALAITERALGREHPDTAQSLNNLGGLLQDQGDLVAARPYFERALAIFTARLGAEHPNTRVVRGNLARLNVLQQSAGVEQGGSAEDEAADEGRPTTNDQRLKDS